MDGQELILAHSTLCIGDIEPTRHPGYSPNLYRYMKYNSHFYRDGGVLDGVYSISKNSRLAEFFGAGTLMLGYQHEGDFIGSRLISVLCNGIKTERYCYPGSAIMVKDFWDRYLLVGRCAIDPDHKQHFLGDRYDFRDDNRTCLWCGAKHRKIITPEDIRVLNESWVSA